MDRVTKFLNKLSQKERIGENKEVFLLSIERKNDNTYKFL